MNADVQETKRVESKVSAQIHKRDVRLNVPQMGTVTLPPLDHLAFYAGIGVLAALEIVEWPVALVIATGHALATNQHNRTLEELGEALESV